MEIIKVIIDTGKANTKGIMEYNGKEYKSIMPTKIEPVAGNTILDSDTVVEYDGERYLVGYGELNRNVVKNQTKLLLEHKVCAFTMIAKLFKMAGIVADKHKIDLTVNIPIIEFIRHEEKTKYHEFFNSEPKVSIVYNGDLHNFEIASVNGLFESSGYIYRYYHKFIDKNVLVMDIGGKNTTYCLFSNLKPQKAYCGSLVYGGNIIINRIRIKLQEVAGLDFNDTRIEDIILGRDTTTLKEHEKEQVDLIIKKQISDTIKVLEGNGMDLDRTDIVFTGGTSKLYEPYLNEFFRDEIYTVSDMPLYDNVIGWLDYAKQ